MSKVMRASGSIRIAIHYTTYLHFLSVKWLSCFSHVQMTLSGQVYMVYMIIFFIKVLEEKKCVEDLYFHRDHISDIKFYTVKRQPN